MPEAAGWRLLGTIVALFALHYAYACCRCNATSSSTREAGLLASAFAWRSAGYDTMPLFDCLRNAVRDSFQVYFAGPCAPRMASESWACSAFFLGHGVLYLAATTVWALIHWIRGGPEGRLSSVLSGFLCTSWLHSLFVEALLLTGQAPLSLLCKLVSVENSPQDFYSAAATVQPGLWVPCFLANIAYKAFLPKPLPRALAVSYLVVELGILLSAAVISLVSTSRSGGADLGGVQPHPCVAAANFPLAVLQLLLSLYMTGLMPRKASKESYVTCTRGADELASQKAMQGTTGSADAGSAVAAVSTATPPGLVKPELGEEIAAGGQSKLVGECYMLQTWKVLLQGLSAVRARAYAPFIRKGRLSREASMAALLKASRVSVLHGKVHIYLPDIDPDQLPPDWMERLKAALKDPKFGGLRVRGATVWKGSTHMVLDVEWEPCNLDRRLRSSANGMDVCQAGSDQDTDMATFLSGLMSETSTTSDRDGNVSSGHIADTGRATRPDALLQQAFQSLLTRAANSLLVILHDHCTGTSPGTSGAEAAGVRRWSSPVQVAIQAGSGDTRWSHFLWPPPPADSVQRAGAMAMLARSPTAVVGDRSSPPGWQTEPAPWCKTLLLVPAPSCPRLFTLPGSLGQQGLDELSVGVDGMDIDGDASHAKIGLRLHCLAEDWELVKEMVCVTSWDAGQACAEERLHSLSHEHVLAGSGGLLGPMPALPQVFGLKRSYRVRDLVRSATTLEGTTSNAVQHHVVDLAVPVNACNAPVALLVVELFATKDLLHSLASTTLLHTAPGVLLPGLKESFAPLVHARAHRKDTTKASVKAKGFEAAGCAGRKQTPAGHADLVAARFGSEADSAHQGCWLDDVAAVLQQMDTVAVQEVRVEGVLGQPAGQAPTASPSGAGPVSRPAAACGMRPSDCMVSALGTWLQQLVRMQLESGPGGAADASASNSQSVDATALAEWPVLCARAAGVVAEFMRHASWPAAQHVLDVMEAVAEYTRRPCDRRALDGGAAVAMLLLLDEPVEVLVDQMNLPVLSALTKGRFGAWTCGMAGQLSAHGQRAKVTLPLALVPLVMQDMEMVGHLEAWLEEREVTFPWTKNFTLAVQCRDLSQGSALVSVNVSATSLAARQRGWVWAAQRAAGSALYRAGGPGATAAALCRSWCAAVAGVRVYVLWLMTVVCLIYVPSAWYDGQYRTVALLAGWPLPYYAMALFWQCGSQEVCNWLVRHAPGINVLINVYKCLVMSLSGPRGLFGPCTTGAFGRFYLNMEWSLGGFLFEPILINLTEPVPLDTWHWLLLLDVASRAIFTLGARDTAIGLGASLQPLAYNLAFSVSVSLVAHAPRRLAYSWLQRRCL